MARGTTTRVEGFAELEKALRDIPKATGKNVLKRVGLAALDPMADKAADLAPVGRGKLSFNITVSDKRTRRAKGPSKNKLVGGKWRASASTGVEIAMGVGAGQGAMQYATFIEFGTIDTAPYPFMRPAFNATADRALDYIKDNLGDEIAKAAAKVAKKRAKAGR